MSIVKFKPTKGPKPKEHIGEISEMILNAKAIYEAEILRLKEVCKKRQLDLGQHRILEVATKSLIQISKEERLIRAEEDLDKMGDEKLASLTKMVIEQQKKAKKTKRKETNDKSDDTTSSEPTTEAIEDPAIEVTSDIDGGSTVPIQ